MAVIVKVPDGVLWKRKDVVGIGVVTAWDFRMAVADGRLVPAKVPGRKYGRYRRDLVATAFGWRFCSENGKSEDPFRATHAQVG